MTFRFSISTPALVLAFALADSGVASAQPIAPAPRPTFSGYSGLFSAGGGYYGYGGGLGGTGFGYGYGGGYGIGGRGGQQNLQLQQQLSQTNQNLANLTSIIASGVNPNLPITGRGAVFNNLGHWYPSSRYGGAGGFGGRGSIISPRMSGAGMGLGGGPGGGVGARTAGSGFPIGNPR